MRRETVTLPPGHYVIADPRYFSENPWDGLPDTFFWSGGDGAFYDNFENCYYVDSARIGVFAVSEIPESLPEGTHHFFFDSNWTIEFTTFRIRDQIKITATPHNELGSDRFR